MNTALEARAIRTSQRLTQIEMSLKADVSLSVIQLFEAGRMPNATGRTCRKLATAYGITVEEAESLARGQPVPTATDVTIASTASTAT